MENNFYNEENINLKNEVLRYLSFWPYFLISLIFFLTSAFFYLRYSDLIYSSSSKIEIIDKAQDSEMSLPTAMTVFNRSMINLENEKGVLSSYRLHRKVVKKLNFNIKLFSVGRFKETENHASEWLGDYDLEIITPAEEINSLTSFDVIFENPGLKINHYNDLGNLINSHSFSSNTTKNQKHNLPFELTVNSESSEISSKRIVFNSFENTILQMQKAVDINESGVGSDQLTLQLEYTNPLAAEDYLNTLVSEFDRDGIVDRQEEYKRTISFVDSRSVFLKDELEQIENNKQDFKESNNLTDISSNAELNVSQKMIYDEEIFKYKSQRDLVILLKDVIENDSNNLIPLDIGIENMNLNNLVSEYNIIYKEKERYLLSAGESNTFVKNLNNQLDEYLNNIKKSINNYLGSLDVRISNLENKENEFSSSYKNIPLNEKILRSIERELEVKEALFLLLLQKREEAAINYAVVKPSIKIIDTAKSSNKPVSPNKRLIYLLFTFVSLLLPFLIISVWFYFDTKIHSKEMLLKYVKDIPVLAEIPYIPKKDKLYTIVSGHSRTSLAESIRMLVSNLNFVLFEKNKEKNNLILVTSSIKGEGKTIISVNTASLIKAKYNKVLIVGADLRNPQLHKFIGFDKDVLGLSNYIYKNDLNWRDLIINNKDTGLDFLLSGTIPPNPTELLSTDKFKSFIKEVKNEYDFVIIDSAPCLLVSDTFEISKLANTTLYVARANFTDIKICEFINDCKKSNKLNNINLVLNSVGNSASYGYKYNYQYGYQYNYQYGYNYGYGYGYSEDKD